MYVGKGERVFEELLSTGEKSERLPQLVEAELNIEYLPVAMVSSGGKRSDSRRVVLDDTIVEGGNIAKMRWEVSPSPEYGSMTGFDLDVYTALTEILVEKGFSKDGGLEFSLYELCKRMGLDQSGKILSDIKTSLLRWNTTTMYSDNAFWLEDEERRLFESFSLISRVSFGSSTKGGKTRQRTRVYFDPLFQRSVLSRYLGKVDTGMYWTLSSKTARRLYRVVEQWRRGESTVELELGWIRERLPLECEEYPSRIKRSLKAAHDELVEKGYLKSVDYPSKGKVYYRISPGYLERYQLLSSGLQTVEEAQTAHSLANVKGVSRKEATKLVLEYGAEHCAYYLDALPYQENVRNPAGWLKGALRESYELADYQLPPSHRAGGGQDTLFETRDQERERRWEGYEGFFKEGEDSGEAATSGGDGDSGSGSTPTPDPDSEAAAVWEEVLGKVSANINAPSLNTWFKEAVPVALKGDVLTLSVPNTFAREYIESRFLGALQGSLSEVLGREGEVVLQERSVEGG